MDIRDHPSDNLPLPTSLTLARKAITLYIPTGISVNTKISEAMIRRAVVKKNRVVFIASSKSQGAYHEA